MSASVGGGAAAAAPPSVGRRPTGPLARFMLLVTVLGLPLTAWSVVELVRVPLDAELVVVLLLGTVLVVGELLPIQIARNGRSSDEITISTTFALALVLLAPLGVVVLAQSLPLVLDDIRRRKHWSRPLFNVAQYTLALGAARAVLCLLCGCSFWTPEPFGRDDLVPAFAAGAAFFLVNHLCVGAAVALWSRERIVPHLLDDIRFQAGTSGLLVCLSPLVLVAAHFSLLLVPVLLLPIAAVRRSAQLATAREHDALHDTLTGLPNRALLQLELTRALGEVERCGSGLAVMLVDLDHFKEINDTLGHHVGDALVRDVAARLRSAVRDDDLVARLGGDEFAVLVCDVDDEQAGREVAERVLDALAESFRIDGVRLDVQASVGVALAPEHGDDGSLLLQRADVALYAAKEHRGCAQVYAPSDDAHSVEKLALLGDLREAVANQALTVVYQPKCDARTRRVTGVEALARWTHPVRGAVPPDEFISIAENTGVIGALTEQVLDKALATCRTARDAGHPITVAVNLSVRVLADLELPGKVAAALGRHGLRPETLTLEVTETSIMSDPVRTLQVLGLLRDLGVVISIDDYGTGYSSLAYLKRLEAQELKIDRSFVTAMAANSNDAVIVRSTIELGHNLGLHVVAEGVEDEQTWNLLRALGCDGVQGWTISRPLTPADLLAFLSSHRDTAADPGRPALLSRVRPAC